MKRVGNLSRTCRLRHSGQGGHVFGPLDLEVILVVDGGEVFEQLEGSQCVRCYGHIDTGIETVNRECLGKHTDVCHAERELQSNPQVPCREFLHNSEDVKLSYSELQHVLVLEFHQVSNRPRQSASTSDVTPTQKRFHTGACSTTEKVTELETLEAIAAFRFYPHRIQHRVDEFCNLDVVSLRPAVVNACPNTELYDLNGCPNGPARTLSMVPGSMSVRIA